MPCSFSANIIIIIFKDIINGICYKLTANKNVRAKYLILH